MANNKLKHWCSYLMPASKSILSPSLTADLASLSATAPLPGQFPRQFLRFGEKLFHRNHLVHQPDPVGFLGMNEIPGKNQFFCQAGTD